MQLAAMEELAVWTPYCLLEKERLYFKLIRPLIHLDPSDKQENFPFHQLMAGKCKHEIGSHLFIFIFEGCTLLRLSLLTV
jgi:hypothetical protein